jgi:glucose-1-phosphate thymidylyltransferase
VKGIVLAGGSGTRLHPLTIATSKQLMPVYDKPMIYYPISTLMLAGIRDFLVITNPHESAQFEKLLGDGSQWGIKIAYAHQDSPRGLADAFLVGEDFIDGQPVWLILGDNVFHGPGLGAALSRFDNFEFARVMAYKVSNPQEYGVVEFDVHGRVLTIEEKPKNPKSSYVIPGLYFYPSDVSKQARKLTPSNRGELEISDLNNLYLSQNRLEVTLLDRGTAWLDTGTFETLIEAAEYVRIVEKRQGLKIGVPEEIAWRLGYIDEGQLLAGADKFKNSPYGDCLRSLIN